MVNQTETCLRLCRFTKTRSYQSIARAALQ